jgi:hypothetical protein
MCTEFLLENLKGRDYLEDLDTNERIILKGSVGNRVGGHG